MTNTEKRILLKDLCARLPYGVKVKITSRESKNRIVYLTEDNICHLTSDWWSECKPYLFPLHSAPKVFIKKYNEFFENYSDDFNEEDEINFSTELIDLFHEHHMDYRGLIDMGLALDATNKNIYSL